MECSTLYTISSINGWRAGAALAMIGPIGKIEDPHAGIDQAIEVAIEAVKILAKR
jgi:uridine phosphorylase